MCLPNAERRTTEAKPVEICRSDIGRTHGSAPTIGRVEHMRNLNEIIKRVDKLTSGRVDELTKKRTAISLSVSNIAVFCRDDWT